MNSYNDNPTLARPLQSLESNFKASIIRSWSLLEAIANKYGCNLEVSSRLQPKSEGKLRDEHGRGRKKFRRFIDPRDDIYFRGLAIDLVIVRPNDDNCLENVEFDLVGSICREIASAWNDKSIKWEGSSDPVHFEWTARARRYEPPRYTNWQPIPQPPALGPIPTPWKCILALLKPKGDP